MRLDIPDMDRIVEVNGLPRISNPLYLDKDGRPLPDGLYSYEVFGRLGTEARRTTFAYVDLGAPFLHPTVYNALIKLDRGIPRVVSGTRWARISPGGYLEEAEEGEKGAGTGLDFLHANWGKFKFKESDSDARQDRLDFVASMPRNVAFATKWLVIPPHYRDLDTSSGKAVSTDILTSLYSKLIGGVSLVGLSSDVALTGNLARARVQEILIDIYSYFTTGVTLRDGTLERKGDTGIAGKRGLIHRSLLAKNIDYTSRVVISGPDLASAPGYDRQQVPYGYTGLPLYTVLTCFFPFIQHELSNFVEQHEGYDIIVMDGKKGKAITTDSIKKLVKLYTGTQDKRLLPVVIREKGGGKVRTEYDDALGRQFNLTDLMFILASWAVMSGETRKHVMVTRYPIEDYRNVVITRVRIMVTERDEVRDIGKMHFDHYPVLDGEHTRWVDSVRPHNGYLPGLGGDFDGDMVSIKGIFTQEANEEAAALIRKPITLLNQSGGTSRSIGNEAIVSLYAMTK